MRLVLTLVAASALLAACGGGGGDSTPATAAAPAAAAPAAATPAAAAPAAATPVASTQATLTSANYVAVAQEAISSVAFLAESSDLALGAQVSDSDVITRFGRAQIPKLAAWMADAPAQAVGAVQTSTQFCAGGGVMTVAVNDVNENKKLDAGDTITVSTATCIFEGAMVSGNLVMTINSITGDLSTYPYSLATTLRFSNLKSQSGLVRSEGNGDMVISINARATNDRTTTETVDSFVLSSTYNGTTYKTSLSNYKTSEVIKPAGSSFTATTSASGTQNSAVFESKAITLSTPTPFVRSGLQAYPASGQYLITGAAGSSIRVTATSATTLRIELDANGDGTYETSTTKLWSEMR